MLERMTPSSLIAHILSITARRPTLGWRIKIIASSERIPVYYRISLVLKLPALASWPRGFRPSFPATSMVPKSRVFCVRSCKSPLQDNHRVAGSDKLI